MSGLDGPERQTDTYLERLSYARIEGPGVTLAYMADDKTHVVIPMAISEPSDVLTGFFFFLFAYNRKKMWKRFSGQQCWF